MQEMIAYRSMPSGRLCSRALWHTVGLLVLGLGERGAAQPVPAAPRPTPLTEVAASLASTGATQGDARAVMAAARIMGVVEAGSARVRLMSPRAGPSGPWDGLLSYRALLELASRVATDHGDWRMADLAATDLAEMAPPGDTLAMPRQPPRTRGAAGGPIWADAFVATGGENVYAIEFEGGGAPNVVQISAGKPSASLECTLHDPSVADRPAVRVRSVSGACVLQWKQAMQGRMVLRIRNRGPDAFYVLSSN